jgi:hypothetical protein
VKECSRLARRKLAELDEQIAGRRLHAHQAGGEGVSTRVDDAQLPVILITARAALWGGLALPGLVAEQGHTVPGAVAWHMAEGVVGKVGLPLAGQGEVGG